MKVLIRLNIVFLALLLLSCGSSGSKDSGASNNSDDDTSSIAQITAPKEGSTFIVGDEIQFTAAGDISSPALEWISNLDGPIGSGETFSLASLHSGVHLIYLTGSDDYGTILIDTVVITVNPGAATGRLPDTGQFYSYTSIFGEDSDYAINPHHYTKLDTSGNPLSADATGWVMVKDDVTGLIWEVKTDDGGIHDMTNTYTYQGAENEFIAQLNSDNFGGFSDWRIPTIKERDFLFDAGTHDPAINTAYFPNTVSTDYMVSEYLDSYYDDDFIVDDAHVYVRAVRGDPLTTNNLTDNGDGTVTDTATELMWQQAETEPMTWKEALSYCEDLELAGYEDWRLPNRNELQSINDNYSEYLPAIDLNFFPDAFSDRYWSSTSNGGNAWLLDFDSGLVLRDSKLESNYTRAVRGGETEDFEIGSTVFPCSRAGMKTLAVDYSQNPGTEDIPVEDYGFNTMDASEIGDVIIAGAQNSKLFYSSDGGVSWYTLEGLGTEASWSGASVSANGQDIAVAGQYLYVSYDSGDTWTVYMDHFYDFSDSSDWFAVSGDTTALAREGRFSSSEFELSYDYGDTWTEYLSPGDFLSSKSTAVFSANGETIGVLPSKGLLLSHDGGETWVEATGDGVDIAGSVQDVDISADGTDIALSIYDYNNEEDKNKVYISTDGGTSWEIKTVDGMNRLNSIAITGNGKVLVSGDEDDPFLLSEDYGNTWQEIPAPPWSRVLLFPTYTLVFSNSGDRIVAMENGFSIWTSDDYGQTWIKRLYAEPVDI